MINCRALIFFVVALSLNCNACYSSIRGTGDIEQNSEVAMASESPICGELVGTVTYEDLEGGLWRFVGEDGESWVLKSSGTVSLEGMFDEAKVKSGSKVLLRGAPANSEGNIGIHMAGPYYEVASVKLIP